MSEDMKEEMLVDLEGYHFETQEDSEETKKFKQSFGFFGPVTLLYAIFYTFCMYKNDSGITYPFFVAGSLLYLYYAFTKLGNTLKKGSIFYMAVMMLLAVSTFCTDDSRLIFFNKLGIFLLVVSILLNQFYDTAKWGLGKFLGSITLTSFGIIPHIFRPIEDGYRYFRAKADKKTTGILAVGIGLLLGVPLLALVTKLLSMADIFFKKIADSIFAQFSFGNVVHMFFMTAFMFVCAYGIFAYLCKKTISEEVKDCRVGQPIIAITVTAMLTVVYALFSVIQILGLFLGKLTLPEGYTYAQYAREGFFELLFVGILNLIIVLVCMHFFKKNVILQVILLIMSLCTFIMNASSAMRMILYIQTYSLTFLRILVLWGLALLTLLFIGVVLTIFKENFMLFRYSVAVVSVMYVCLSFAHPDYIIAKYNLSKVDIVKEIDVVDNSRIFSGNVDFRYLRDLCTDAAPAIIPFLEKAGYDLSKENLDLMISNSSYYYSNRGNIKGFGYEWIVKMIERQKRIDADAGIRGFNVSRYRATSLLEQYSK